MFSAENFSSITKRDGKKEAFDARKITTAISKAGLASGEFDDVVARQLTIRVLNVALTVMDGVSPTVEAIQDIVEDVLLTSPYRKTAKAYILYREQHRKIREMSIQFTNRLVDQYLEKADWKVNENSNMSFSLQGLNNYMASEISKKYWLESIYPESVREAHRSGEMHIHDLGSLSVYCVGWDLFDLLREGFRGVEGKIESGPPRHFSSVLGQIVNFFYTLQGEAAGAQAFSNFDTLLSPYIRYDGLDYAGVKQKLQEFVFNLNVPTRVGFQTPFTNLSFDLTVPSHLANLPVIIGGEMMPETYGEFTHEMALLNRAFIEVMMEGDARGRIFSFPIPTYAITNDFNWEDESLESFWEATAKYGFAYFSNFVNSDMKPEDARSMCCRLRIDNRELRKRGGGLFGASPLTGSIGVVTINLPRIGYIANTEDEFFAELLRVMHLGKESLEIKRKVLEKFSKQNLYPYSNFYLRHVKQRYNEYWKNHFSTIGLIGMNEACLNFLGEDVGSDRGNVFAQKVLSVMRQTLSEFQEETGCHYNLEATPAESTGYRMAQIDKRKFPEIIFANNEGVKQGNEPFYTNSSNLPADYSDDIFEVLELQKNIQNKYTGGTVLHIFLGERVDNVNAVKRLVRKICQNYEIPYFTITPTFSICPCCGYKAGKFETCPTCGSECEIYSRVVGYYRTVKQWNKGKQEEFKTRKVFDKACESVVFSKVH